VGFGRTGVGIESGIAQRIDLYSNAHTCILNFTPSSYLFEIETELWNPAAYCVIKIMDYIRSEKDFVIILIKIVPHVLIMQLVIVNAYLLIFMIKTCNKRENKK